MLLKRIAYILLCILTLFSFEACIKSEKKTNWEIQYTLESKDPYGFYLFGEMLPHLYPQAKIHFIPSNANIFTTSSQQQKSVYVVLAGAAAFSEQEMRQLDDWMYEGNDVVIIADEWDTALVQALPVKVLNAHHALDTDTADHTIDKVYTLKADGQRAAYQSKRMYYNIFPGFLQADTAQQQLTEIAWDDKGNICAAVLRIGDGKMVVATNFLSCSNYFLLQGNNREFLSDIFSYTSKDAKNVYFMVASQKRTNRSDWSVLWEHKATRAAIILSFVGLLIYVLFGLKRKQKSIPEIAPLTNDAASFAATIASLYYNKHNNRNLAQKMIQHFLEHVRTSYQLNTNVLDQAFVEKLSLRSGIALAATEYLFSQIRQVQSDSTEINDAFLHSLYRNIQQFYKK